MKKINDFIIIIIIKFFRIIFFYSKKMCPRVLDLELESESEPEPEPPSGLAEAGAGSKWIGSTTLTFRDCLPIQQYFSDVVNI